MRLFVDHIELPPHRLTLSVFDWDRGVPVGDHALEVVVEAAELAALGARAMAHADELDRDEPGYLDGLAAEGGFRPRSADVFVRTPAALITYLADDFWRSFAIQDLLAVAGSAADHDAEGRAIVTAFVDGRVEGDVVRLSFRGDHGRFP